MLRYYGASLRVRLGQILTPLLTIQEFSRLREARIAGRATLDISIDLQRSKACVALGADCWSTNDAEYPYFDAAKERTIYYWHAGEFAPVARFTGALFKLVPTEWGAPTFEIDGIKMLPSEALSPYADAGQKVALIEPRGKTILDCCAGLGYFAAHALAAGAARIDCYEKNGDVLWLRSLNPWSPPPEPRLCVQQARIEDRIAALPDRSFDAILHDPPRISIAGELYSASFYAELARVIRPRGRLFHYTGSPHRLTRKRDLAGEVLVRLRAAGFLAEKALDGLLAVRAA